MGPRGRVHADAFCRNDDRFELVALCELDQDRLRYGVQTYGFQRAYADAETMLAETRPDVFCFVTLPHLRLPLVELAAKYRVKGLAFEKPMATSLQEAWTIREVCRQAGIKAVVSHQQKYLSSLQALKGVIARGEIGAISEIHATTQAWLSQLGTHFTDYMLWANGGARAQWVVGHVHGAKLLDDSHPSPDYVLGQIGLEDGVRGIIECGYLAPQRMDAGHFWVDNRLTVHGTQGTVWAETDGRWGACNRATGGEAVVHTGDTWETQQEHIQVPYIRELADWLDDTTCVHSCNVDTAYHGYEILEGLCLSALNHTRVDLPLKDPATTGDLLARMRRELPQVGTLGGSLRE
jgi:predicted dehydrogenase